MNTPQYHKLRQLFRLALPLPPDEREQLITEHCGDDVDLRRELEALLSVADDTMAEHSLVSDRRIDDQRRLIDADTPQTVALHPNVSDRTVPLPERIGPFAIRGIIGEGGMGTVYEAEQDNPKRTVALKVIRPGVASAEMLKRFALESQVLGRLQHPGIAQVYQAGTADTDLGQVPYFAMEYVRGVDLRTYITGKNVTPRERLNLLAHICDAVHHAHQKGVIHRDLKPGNILVDESGQPRILDFGVARATDADLHVTMNTDVGQLIGTLQYMSPEQVAADPDQLDTRSDVYALGVIAYELMTGHMPYDLKNQVIHEAARIIREEEPQQASAIDSMFRGDVETIIGKALAKDKERRYESAAGLAEDIRRHLRDEPILARPPTVLYQLQKLARRHRALAAGTGIALAALIIGLITSTYSYFQAETARAGEQQKSQELARVTDFQRSMISNIKIARMGQTTIAHLRKELADGLSRANTNPDELNKAVASFDQLVARVNPSEVALNVLADEILDRAIDTIEQDFDDQPLTRAALQDAVGMNFFALGLYERAAALHQSAYDTRRAQLDGPSEAAASSLNNLALAHDFLGEYDTAEKMYRDALAIRQRVHGNDHLQVASSMSNLAGLLMMTGDFEQAEDLYRKTLAMRRRVITGDHRDMADSLDDLATVLAERGNPQAAEPLYREALSMRRRLFGDEHEHIAYNLHNLSILLEELGRLDESEQLIREALAMFRHLLGNNHIEVANSLNALGLMYIRQGRYDAAQPPLEEALAIYHDRNNDADLARALDRMATLYGARGDWKQSEVVSRESLALAIQALGDDHVLVADYRDNLAFVLHELGEYDAAYPLIELALDTHRRVHGDDHQVTLKTTIHLARTTAARGDLDKAAAMFATYMPKARAAYPADHWRPSNFELFHGQCLLAMKRFAEAEERFLAAYDIMVNAFGPDSPRLTRIKKELIALYDAWHTAHPDQGHDATARAWRSRLPDNQ